MKRILIIEDDNDILEVIKTILSMNDYDVIAINSTDDIIESVRQHDPTLVLTDYLLPGMNGGKICQLIKKTQETCHIPVVLMSAYQELAIAIGNFGFDAFIHKPFNINHLVKTVNNCVSVRAANSA